MRTTSGKLLVQSLRHDAKGRRPSTLLPVNAIFPRHVAPVVRHALDGEREIVSITWGFVRHWKGRAPRPRPTCARTISGRTRSGASRLDSAVARPGIVVLGTQWRCEVRDLALVRDRPTRGRSLPSQIFGVATGAGEEGWIECRDRDLFVPNHHHAQSGGRHHQTNICRCCSRAKTSSTHGRYRLTKRSHGSRVSSEAQQAFNQRDCCGVRDLAR